MTIAQKVFKQASWLAMFKFISQIFSWAITILIARILVPSDYGLIAMATIITGYAMIFSDIGIGAAIIQRPNPTQEELSSVFWFTLFIGSLFGFGCYFIAYPAAALFKEPMVTPIMQTISVTFIIFGLQIVPSNLLRKSLEFKKLGTIDLLVTFISSVSMLFIAYNGLGVWALVGGIIIRSVTNLVLIFSIVRWFPIFIFDFKKVKPYLKFGIILATSGSFFYVYEQSDKYFAGRAWPADALGYYSFALELVKIPMNKIVSLINQVSFPLLSRFQADKEKFNETYLGIVKINTTLVIPLYVGGFLLSDSLIRVLLDKKWIPIIFLFKYLCLAQIITSINAINTRVHISQGRPHWSLWYNLICATLMAISFYFAVQHGLNAILIPWFTTYVIICVALIILTLNKIGVKLYTYLKVLSKPLLASLTMVIVIQGFSCFMIIFDSEMNLIFELIIKIGIGGLTYITFLWFIDRKIFYDFQSLFKSR